jgi:hypothetical protein
VLTAVQLHCTVVGALPSSLDNFPS